MNAMAKHPQSLDPILCLDRWEINGSFAIETDELLTELLMNHFGLR